MFDSFPGFSANLPDSFSESSVGHRKADKTKQRSNTLHGWGLVIVGHTMQEHESTNEGALRLLLNFTLYITRQ
jgi:hypothetical protein